MILLPLRSLGLLPVIVPRPIGSSLAGHGQRATASGSLAGHGVALAGHGHGQRPSSLATTWQATPHPAPLSAPFGAEVPAPQPFAQGSR